MWVLGVLCLGMAGVGLGAHFSVEPKDVTVTAGENVTLDCDITGMTDSPCQWTRAGELLGQDSSLPSHPRMHMEGCRLIIRPVLQSDDADYQCQAGHLSTKSAHITVMAEPGVPYIRQGREGSALEVRKGGRVELDCESQGGKPPAEIQWRQGGQPVTDVQKVTEQVTKLGNTRTWRTVSTFAFIPEDAANVTCEAFSSEFPAKKISLPLEVKVRFRPKVEIMVSRDVVREGDSFEVLCKSRAYPEEIGYRWFFSGAELEGMVNNSILIEEITRMYDQSDITCLVENEEGRAEASTNINVRFPPAILLHPRSQIAKAKDNVTFHCVAEGNPVPVYLWTRGRTNSLIEAGRQNLSLIASEKTEAVYRCQVFAEGQELVSSLPASLTLIRKPIIDTETERFGNLGEDLILQCRTRSVSNRTRIIWLKDLEPVDLTQERFSVLATYREREQLSDLLIRNLGSEDFGHYGCFAENEVGTDLAQMLVMEEAGTNILSTVTGVSVVFGILLLVGIFVYYRVSKQCGTSDSDKS